MAAEHHGLVQSDGLPVPGATVTATKGDQKLATTTDDRGAYSFRNLPDGIWTIKVEMLGFATLSTDVAIAPDAPSPTWDLQLLSAQQLAAALSPARQEPAAAGAKAAPAATTAAAPAASSKPAAPGTPARPTQARMAEPQRQQQRPSLRDALENENGGFQRMDVNQAADLGLAGTDGALTNSDLSGDLAQSANDAYVVNGSVSSGLGMPQQNDWFQHGDGMGPGMMMGGPGGPGGPGGEGPSPPDMGGRRDMSSRGGGPPGGGPGGFPGGGPGGFGGRHGGGFSGHDHHDRGSSRSSANSFGNGRRNSRPHYIANLAFILDNSALDARPFSLTGQATPKPSTANARMTGILGGPLKIPHLLSGDHTFFMINYQLTRSRQGNTVTGLVPTAAERAGDFSQAVTLSGKPASIFDPLTGQPFPGNIIPQNRINSAAAGLLNYYPLPNFLNNARYNYQAALVNTSNQDNINTRISQTINAKNQVNGNFSFQRANGITPNLFNFTDTNQQNAYNSGVSWTYHFTTHLINSAGVNFSRNSTSTNPYFANFQNVSGLLGITGNDQNPAFWGPPKLSFANGFSSLSDGSTTLGRVQTSSVNESVKWYKGKHNMTFGGNFRILDNSPLSEQNARGTFMFTGGNTAGPGNVGGYDMADFLLGNPDTRAIAYGNADKYFRSGWLDAYMVDDWRISTRLSLNLGLRWEYQMPTTEEYGRLVNLDITQNFTNATLVCATTVAGCTPNTAVGFPSSLIRGDPLEFQPRIGFAWRPAHNTVVRGGYGIYFNTSVFQSIVTQMAQQQPLSISYNSPGCVGLTGCMFFPATSTLANPVTTFAVNPNFDLGYVQSYQMSVQQTLPWAGLVATATYSGMKGTHQQQEFIPNSAPPGARYLCGEGAICPTNFDYLASGGNTVSNNLWLQLQRRFHSGLMGNLVFAHNVTITDGAVGGRGASAPVAQNWLDLDAERGLAPGIRVNTLTASLVYSTGMGMHGGGLMKGPKSVLLRDWTISTNITLAGGAPLTPTVMNSALGGTSIVGPLRPDYTGQPLFLDGLLNPAAFSLPPTGTYGNTGRGVITGPGLFSLNASAGRIIRLGERRSVDIRLDATNALNHVSIASWITTVNSPQFGLPSGAAAMRSVRAMVRFRF